MTFSRRLAILLSVMCLTTFLLGLPGVVAGAATGPQLPQLSAAQQAAQWLSGQMSPQGFVPTTPGGSQPNFSSTAQTVLALSAANVNASVAGAGLAFLQANVNSYVTVDGGDGPGQLALLILDAVARGANPRAFGGTDLVARLLATQQAAGTDAGLFGTEAQVAGFAAGSYQQGLALAALAGAGVRGTAQLAAAVSWLDREQCPNGGWTTPAIAVTNCSGNPAAFAGPDTNATAVALQGLAAEGAITTSVSTGALSFLSGGQDADAGWPLYPNTATAPGTSDPDSTALVIQALLAAGVSPTGPSFTKGSATPVSTLLTFQLTSGPDAGAFYFPPAPSPANIIATYQAVPALMGLPIPLRPLDRGYWEVASDGGIFSFGDAPFLGSMGAVTLNKPVVGIASTPDGKGYWEVASDGGIFSFGDAPFLGSMGAVTLNKPVVGIASTPDGKGYWEVASDGGIFSFGDAPFLGSMGAVTLNKPVVGIASTPDGKGYWEVASDGGIFSFGDAPFLGSMGAVTLNKPVVGIASTPDGKGYWEVASDGGIFSFGDAPFLGSMGAVTLNKPVVGIASTPDGKGYWEVASDGGIFSFGDAPFLGSMGAVTLNKPVVGIASTPGT